MKTTKRRTRTLNINADQARLSEEIDAHGVRHYLVLEDFMTDGTTVSRRVRVPLYGANAREFMNVLRAWKKRILEEAAVVP